MSHHSNQRSDRQSEDARSVNDSPADAVDDSERMERSPTHRVVVKGLGRLLPVLFGLVLISAIVAAVVVGVSTWITAQGTGFSVVRAVVTGGGLLIGSVVTFYLGVTLGRCEGETVISPE